MMKEKIIDTKAFINYQNGSIVSKMLINTQNGTITVFAFDKNQGLSEHTAPFDAFVQILEGEAQIRIAGVDFILKKDHSIIMPANKPHAVYAKTQMKMMLTMIKN